MTTSEDQTGVSRADLLRGGLGLTAAVAAGSLLTGGTANASGEREHPNVRLIKDYYEAYGSGDLNRLRRFFANDIRWTIPGHHPLSGTKQGIDEVLAFFRELGKAGFRAETVFLAADGDWVVDLHRGWSTKPQGLDILWALAFRIRNRKIVEAVNFAADQHAADQYFWKTYKLAPLPTRLA
ncbi:nuclear transport factor 2 family protein [Kibdelosporangium philippinense]|uniref:Nuclear transport factor 2 family protein n=1 Tax=Kibdelosporangium philippinense TaxID=211113 RepID=A0ABS8ZH89_9PSEU|nr:nuclear transport factor 2 family protein [Kibdelosporangium philippinense]MCE7007185.1 nuclear transport factor 2 family protein [Kibdelosporangium philippinense]